MWMSKMEKHRDNDVSSSSLVCSETLHSLLTRANENTDGGWKREGKKITGKVDFI